MDNSHVQEFKSLYLKGLPINGEEGFTFSDDELLGQLELSESALETSLNIKLSYQEIIEDIDAVSADLTPLVKIKATYPIVELSDRVEGYFGNIKYLDLPKEWLKVNKNNYGQYLSTVFVIPNVSTSPNFYGPLYMGAIGLQGVNIYSTSPLLPGFWKIKYMTGFQQIPDDILQYIYMDAASNLLVQLGDLLYGIGSASEELQLDDLRQKNQKQTGEFGAFSPRINLYNKRKEDLYKKIRAKYRGVRIYVI